MGAPRGGAAPAAWAAPCGRRQTRSAATRISPATTRAGTTKDRRPCETGALMSDGGVVDGSGASGTAAGCGRRRGRRRQLPPPNALGERRDLGVRRQLQLLLPDLVHDVGVADRSRRVAGGGQRPHQAQGGRCIGRVDGGEAAPPEHGAGPVVASGGGCGRRLEQGAVVGRDPLPLLLGPAGELRRARQMEVAQKRAGVQPRGLLERARRARGLEGRQIHLDQLGIEPQVAGAEDGLLGAQLLAQGVERLVEAPAGALLLHLTPQESAPDGRDSPPDRRRAPARQGPPAAGAAGRCLPGGADRRRRPGRRASGCASRVTRCRTWRWAEYPTAPRRSQGVS